MFYKQFLLLLCALNIRHSQRCTLNSRNDFREPLPVILRNGQLLEPDDASGNVIMDNEDILTLSCEGSGILEHPNAIDVVSTATISCDNGNLFTNPVWLSAPSEFSQFRCSLPPNYVSRRTNQTCYDDNKIINVGYDVQNVFYPVYESCFNEDTLTVIYSKYQQKNYNAHFQTRVDRPFFIANDNYGQTPVNSLFSPRGQKAAVSQLVGPMTEKYITATDFLSRGHLAAKTDFVFAFGQRATFHYVNCAPQWYGFNSGNWNTLEVELRNHINNAGYNTVIYTGTYGVSQLVDQYGTKVDINLYSDKNNNPVIPLPLYFYKVVYEPRLGLGTAFVGINNPHYNHSELQDLVFCKDLCRQNPDFSWLIWRPDSAHDGYAFCCSISDFRNTVHHLPQFMVHGLLT